MDAGDGTLYTATRDGWIKRMHANGSWEDWKFVGGSSLLGLTLSRAGHLLVADADKGLLKVGKEGVVILASQVNGTKIRFADDVIEASDGSIYFSDASCKFGLDEWFFDVLEGRPHGRLLKYDATSQETTLVLTDLAFANGVALSADDDFLVVCETWKFRCLKHWLKGEKKGETEIFVDNLPGGPDNIKLAPDGSFWVAILKLRSTGMDLIHRSATVKKVFAVAFPEIASVKFLGAMKKGAMVANVGSDGKIRRVLDDSQGKMMSFVTSALEFDDHLYMGSLLSDFIGKLKLK
ncbi:adipocyte plasma membrane-associated protein-like [Canna indica]|uniref:Adipocyte plasma membrane-associated protein-like n=1 Tax=Canna indica TaxID=4628 RepID=A0AAQ3K2Z1_9LILI|nr:adipocyte plasma membrane-associated protein-like [Canna indica]